MQVTSEATTSRAQSGYWARLFHRWFVQYNPLYVLSAALVLVGSLVCSRGLSDASGSLAVELVTELYALSLIGGAALLVRIRLRRPAVMLGLLAAFYQWDLMLHTETSAYLGSVGLIVSVAWVALAALKLGLLARALRLRFSRHFVAALSIATIGLAALPHIVFDLEPRSRAAVISVWLFAIGSSVRSGAITSKVDLDGWGTTVLRRATRAVWLLSGGFVTLHVLFWWTKHPFPVEGLVPAALLLTVRRERESRAWAIALGVLAATALLAPSALAVTGLLVGGSFMTRVVVALTGAWSSLDSRMRAFAGALFALHLSLWSAGWTGGVWPAHVVALDLWLAAGIGILALRHVRSALIPLALYIGHLLVERRIVPLPHTALQWGATSVGLGFALLAMSLTVAYRNRTPEP